MARHRTLPPVAAGYSIEHWIVSIIRARAAENLFANPSFETGTTGATAVSSASLARTASKQRRGAYSLQVTPGAGVNSGVYISIALTAGVLYHFSVDVWGAPGNYYRLVLSNTTGTTYEGTSKFFTGHGRWVRPDTLFVAPATATFRFFVQKDPAAGSASTRPFYVDGLQCERDRLTTYLDGDQQGLVRGQRAYYWSATPHASTSHRIAATRAGGEEVKLSSLGLRLLTIAGLGLSGIANVFTANAGQGGAQYERSVITERGFSLTGALFANAPDGTLERQRADLIGLVKPGAAIVQQPLILKLEPQDADGDPIGECVEIPCTYDGGLEGVLDNPYQERVTVSFRLSLPFVARLAGEVATELAYEDTVAAMFALQRRLDGVWAPLPGSGFDDSVNVIAADEAHGRIYFGGLFTTADGVTVNRVCYLNLATGTYHAMGSGTVGVNSAVFALAITPQGDVWVGGQQTQAGGSNSFGLARYNAAANTWTQFTDGTSGDIIYALALTDDGGLLGAGDFTGWDGDADQDYIWYYDGSSFSPIGTGMNAEVFSLLFDPVAPIPGTFYAAGAFTTGNGTTLNRVGKGNYLTGTFTALPGPSPVGVNNVARSVKFNRVHHLVVAGDFTVSPGGTNAAEFLAVHNGSQWLDGIGATSTPYLTASILTTLDVQGVGQAGGGGAHYVGSDLVLLQALQYRPEILLDTAGPVQALEQQSVPGVLYVGLANAISIDGPAVTTVHNPGSEDAGLVVELTGPGTVDRLRNLTNGDALYMSLTLQAGQRATLSIRNGRMTFTDQSGANLLNTLLTGSHFRFRLVPGDNEIELFIGGTTDSDTAAVLRLQPVYDSLDSVVW